ncbi:hypothetical protein EV421DRAFT_1721679, partial [Armillaria borealis]
KKYLTHVKSMHTDLNLPFIATESPMIQHIIQGIKCFHGKKDRKPKQPITLPVLIDILAHFQPEAKPGHLAVYAACCIAFSGLLHCGEFTAKSADKIFLPAFQLSQASVQFLSSFDEASYAILFLPTSKTDPFQKDISICLAAALGRPTCSITVLKALIPNGTVPDIMLPLFLSLDDLSKSITCAFFISTIHKAFTSASYDPTLFVEHSFQQDGASAVAVAECSDHEIQMLGH